MTHNAEENDKIAEYKKSYNAEKTESYVNLRLFTNSKIYQKK